MLQLGTWIDRQAWTDRAWWKRAAPIQRRRKRHEVWWRLGIAGAAGAVGAGVMYILDPQLGRRRRHLVVDRSAATVRRSARGVQRWGRRTTADAAGTVHRVRHLWNGTEPAASDTALADRVKSEIFRDPMVPQGHINLNVEDGVVVLRGQLDRPEQIRDLTEAARKVPGVRDVTSYLHLPDMPAPNKASAMTADV